MAFQPFPADFPNKGWFIDWSPSWERRGYVDEPPYAGAQPIRFPEGATPLECALGGYLRPNHAGEI